MPRKPQRRLPRQPGKLDLTDFTVEMLVMDHFSFGGPILDGDPWLPQEEIAELWQEDIGHKFYRDFLDSQVRFPNTQRPTPWAIRKWGPPCG